jgi:hypothetical protein
MSKSALSVMVFGGYLVGMGAGFLILPNTVLGLLGFPPSGDVWIRILGVLALILAYYYINAARNNIQVLFVWSVHTRIFAFLAFAGLVLMQQVGPMLAVLGGVDLASALWTWFALRNEQIN